MIKSMSNTPQRLQTTGGLNFHVLNTLVFRCWSVAAGAVTVLLLPLWLSPVQQGYYFTFASIVSLQIFFELGLTQIVIQLVSHEVAHLKIANVDTLTGDEARLDRLSSLARLMRSWYRGSAALFLIVGGSVGAGFFYYQGVEPIKVWLEVWIVLVLATAANILLCPYLAVIEGCGQVGQVSRLRLYQSVLGYSCLWSGLLLGFGLWVTIAVPAVAAACTCYWVTSKGRMLRRLASRNINLTHQFVWRRDVLPLQWRIALSWISGYLIFNLFTPIVFSYHGATEAGRLGLALMIFSAISAIGMSWINANAPNLTMHIARGERNELKVLFRAAFIRSTVLVALLSIFLVLLAAYLSHYNFSSLVRLAPANVLIVLAVATIFNAMIFSMAAFMRAHREEPMVTQSVVVGILVAVSAYTSSNHGVLDMMRSYMWVTIAVSFPWTGWLFLKYWNR